MNYKDDTAILLLVDSIQVNKEFEYVKQFKDKFPLEAIIRAECDGNNNFELNEHYLAVFLHFKCNPVP